MERCKRVSDRRNEFIHSGWGKKLDGVPFRRANDHSWQPIPTIEELTSLGKDTLTLTQQLNEARLFGLLAEALVKRQMAK